MTEHGGAHDDGPVAVLLDGAVAPRLSADQLAGIGRVLRRMVAAAGLHEACAEPLEANLRLCDDQTIHALNRDYRGMDKPTDVLAFAMREAPAGSVPRHILGDIVISLDTASRQATDRGKALVEEVVFLMAHGLCHLLGYDHRDDAEEAEMNARMESLLAEAEREGRVRSA